MNKSTTIFFLYFNKVYSLEFEYKRNSYCELKIIRVGGEKGGREGDLQNTFSEIHGARQVLEFSFSDFRKEIQCTGIQHVTNHPQLLVTKQ